MIERLDRLRNTDPIFFDHIIEAVKEEIEKVGLPEYKKSWTSDGLKFEDCLVPVTPEDTRQAILKLLEGNK